MSWATRLLIASLTAIAAVAAVSSCGGGSLSVAGGGTDGTGSPAQFSQGVITKGSVILNGVRFDDTSAVVLIEGQSSIGGDQLATGMFVKLRGRLNADGVTGIAERIEVANEVRGTITAISAAAQPASFVVVGQTVLVDSTTVYANVSGLGGLNIGQRVEVHGLRDGNGRIRASRVELLGAGLPDEIKGVVSSLTTATFSLGNVTVNFAGAAITPARAALSNGQSVEVRGSFNGTTSIFMATRIEREDLKEPLLQPGAGDELEVEGFVTDLTISASTFVISGRTVRYSSATKYEDGSAGNLANGVEVEAKGKIDATGALNAEKIEFKRASMNMQGLASAVDAAQRRLTLLGQIVRIDDLTEIRAVNAAGRDSTSLTDITANLDRVKVRGRLDSSGALIAERLEETNDRDDEVQGRVSAKNEPARMLTILGVNITLNNAAFRRDDKTISAAAFFAAITPTSANAAGTVVTVKGVFVAGSLAAQEAELED